MKFVRINESDISSERLNGETIIISFSNGSYYNAAGTAADLLFLISKQIHPEMWSEILAKAFSGYGEDSDHITFFIEKGLSEGILKITDEESLIRKVIDLPNDTVRDNWIEPKLDKYEDFQDLLMVDPIHDTTEEGWPKLNDE